ncbi:SAM-dependent methyltransferase, partial [Rhodococcus sp. NPDC058514]
MTAHTGRDRTGVMLGGVYRDESRTQHDAAAVGYPLIGRALAHLPPPDGFPVLIADFGAAQGTNSQWPIALALDRVRELAPSVPVLVVHTDLPGNDFAGLFDAVEHGADSYLVGRPQVFPLVAGRSFYRRILPDARLAFGWSSSSLHWLSATPAPIPDHFFVHLSRDAAAREAYQRRSRRDWIDFLEHRAAELCPGGGVVVVD